MQRPPTKPSTIWLNLVTYARTIDNKKIPLTAACEWLEEVPHYVGGIKTAGKKAGDTFKVYLYNNSEYGREFLGDMLISIISSPDGKPMPWELKSSIYRDKNNVIAPYAEIVDMHNESKRHHPEGYKDIGAALHECAFRLSLMHGCEGRILLQAVRNTHYFHYKSGFRIPQDQDYYYKLADAVVTANGNMLTGDLGSQNLYLPRN